MPLQVKIVAPLLGTSAMVVTVLYGVFGVVHEVCLTVIPLSLLLMLLLVAFVYWTSNTTPEDAAVEAIVGKNLRHIDVDVVGKSSVNPCYHLMKTVAHRGAGLDAPENSLPAFQMCSDKGCGYIEFDVIMSSDNVPVVFHDRSLERMTDLNGDISDLTYEEVQQLDISVKHAFKDRFTNTKIPTLDETIEQLLKNNQRMFIDVKNNDSRIVDVILQLFEKHEELYSRAVVSSFFPYVIYNVRRRNPKIVCSIAWRPHVIAYKQYGFDIDLSKYRRSSTWYRHYTCCFLDVIYEWVLNNLLYMSLGISLILLHKDCISPKVVADWESKGVRVVAWTVNHPVEKQYFTRVLKITYMTDTLTGEASAHSAPN